MTPRPQDAPADWLSNHVVGEHAVDPGSIAHIVKRRSAAAGYHPDLLGGHSLKRDAKNTAKVAAPIPPSLHSLAARQLRHPRRLSRAGDLFENHALNFILIARFPQAGVPRTHMDRCDTEPDARSQRVVVQMGSRCRMHPLEFVPVR